MGIFTKICHKIEVWLKTDRNNRHLAWTPCKFIAQNSSIEKIFRQQLQRKSKYIFNVKCSTQHWTMEQEHKKTLRDVARDWTGHCGFQRWWQWMPLEKKPTPSGPSVDLPERFSRNLNGHKWGKILGGGQGDRNYCVRQCMIYILHTRGRMEQDIFFNFILCHHIKDPVLKDAATLWNITAPSVYTKLKLWCINYNILM